MPARSSAATRSARDPLGIGRGPTPRSPQDIEVRGCTQRSTVRASIRSCSIGPGRTPSLVDVVQMQRRAGARLVPEPPIDNEVRLCFETLRSPVAVTHADRQPPRPSASRVPRSFPGHQPPRSLWPAVAELREGSAVVGASGPRREPSPRWKRAPVLVDALEGVDGETVTSQRAKLHGVGCLGHARARARIACRASASPPRGDGAQSLEPSASAIVYDPISSGVANTPSMIRTTWSRRLASSASLAPVTASIASHRVRCRSAGSGLGQQRSRRGRSCPATSP